MNLDYRINKATFKIKFYYKKYIYFQYDLVEKLKEVCKRNFNIAQIKVLGSQRSKYIEINSSLCIYFTGNCMYQFVTTETHCYNDV